MFSLLEFLVKNADCSCVPFLSSFITYTSHENLNCDISETALPG
jgi:hypothetical protein